MRTAHRVDQRALEGGRAEGAHVGAAPHDHVGAGRQLSERRDKGVLQSPTLSVAGHGPASTAPDHDSSPGARARPEQDRHRHTIGLGASAAGRHASDIDAAMEARGPGQHLHTLPARQVVVEHGAQADSS
jgi:hypothetical protein